MRHDRWHHKDCGTCAGLIGRRRIHVGDVSGLAQCDCISVDRAAGRIAD